MSEQTVETKIETEFQPDSTGNLVPQSEEECYRATESRGCY